MKQALGLLEVQGLSTAVVAADTMAKAANVRLLEVENTKGSGYMTIKVTGDVGAVNASVQAGRQTAIENRKLVSWKVIPRPSDYVEHTFCSPASPVSEKSAEEKTALSSQEQEAEANPLLTEAEAGCAQPEDILPSAEPEIVSDEGQQETEKTKNNTALKAENKRPTAKGGTARKGPGTNRKNKGDADTV